MAETKGNTDVRPKGGKSVKFDVDNHPKVVLEPQASWFQPLKHPDGDTDLSFKGDGVPVDDARKPGTGHGYWLRRQRRAGGKQLPPVSFFYYTGTGPRDRAQFGEDLPYVVWVSEQDANTSKVQKTRLRDPAKDGVAFPLRFKPNHGPQKGFVIQRGSKPGTPVQSTQGSRQSTPGGSRKSSATNSGTTTPVGKKKDEQSFVLELIDKLSTLRGEQVKPKKVTKEAVKEAKARSFQKRQIPLGGKVADVFGQRTRVKNFGDGTLLEKGSADPRFPTIMSVVPGPQALLFGGTVSAEDQGDSWVFRFEFETKVKKEGGDPNVFKYFQENIDGDQERGEKFRAQRQQMGSKRDKDRKARKQETIDDSDTASKDDSLESVGDMSGTGFKWENVAEDSVLQEN